MIVSNPLGKYQASEVSTTTHSIAFISSMLDISVQSPTQGRYTQFHISLGQKQEHLVEEMKTCPKYVALVHVLKTCLKPCPKNVTLPKIFPKKLPKYVALVHLHKSLPKTLPKNMLHWFTLPKSLVTCPKYVVLVHLPKSLPKTFPKKVALVHFAQNFSQKYVALVHLAQSAIPGSVQPPLSISPPC